MLWIKTSTNTIWPRSWDLSFVRTKLIEETASALELFAAFPLIAPSR